MTTATTTPARDARSAATTTTGPVLVAAGGSDATAVLHAASALAATTGRTMVALAVLEPHQQYVTGLEPVFLPPAFDEQRVAHRQAVLRKQLAAAGVADWRVEVVHGAPGPTVAEVARTIGASMIVMGIGRHHPLDRLLGGETTLQAVRHAPCAVLVVVPEAAPPFRHAVVATDFGPASARSAETAMAVLAEGATVSLVHAWQPEKHGDAPLAPRDRAYLDGVPERFHRLREALHVPAGITVKDVVREGHPTECVLDYAAAQQADLIVAGRRKLPLLTRLALGSVTTSLLRAATRSLLVTPEPSFQDSDRYRRLLSGSSESHHAADWEALFRDFTARNQGRRIALEVDDLTIGAQVTETGYHLIHAAFDPDRHRLELEVGTEDGADRHVTRRIMGIQSVVVATDARGNDMSLQVLHGPGQTILTFTGA